MTEPDDPEHPPTNPVEITLPVIFAAIMDLRADLFDALEAQRTDLEQGQSGFRKIAQDCANHCAEAMAAANELARNHADHERRIQVLEERVLPPQNGADG